MDERNRFDSPSSAERAGLLPAHFSDGRVAAAVYTAPFERARAAVLSKELHPIELPGRRAFVLICTFEYLASTLGPYREVAVGVVVRTKPHSGPFSAVDLFSTNPDTGAWITSMPVTSESAREYGVQLFGFPKTVCTIDVQRTSSLCTTTVLDAGQPVLVTRIPLGRGLPLPVPWLVTYTQKDGAVLRTRIKTTWWVTLNPGTRAGLELANSEHPLAAEIRRLQLSKSPLFVLHGARFRAILPAGERI